MCISVNCGPTVQPAPACTVDPARVCRALTGSSRGTHVVTCGALRPHGGEARSSGLGGHFSWPSEAPAERQAALPAEQEQSASSSGWSPEMVRGPCLTPEPESLAETGGQLWLLRSGLCGPPQLLLQPSCCPAVLGFPGQVSAARCLGRVLGRCTDPGCPPGWALDSLPVRGQRGG